MLSDIVEANILVATSDISEFTNFIELNNNIIDVILLDINMPLSSGFDLAEYIKSNFPTINIIFMSAFQEYLLHGYKYYPEDFLVKPINIVRLKNTFRYIAQRQNSSTSLSKSIGIKSNNKFNMIEVDQILFIEKKGRKSLIYLVNQEIIESSNTLVQLEEMLDKDRFFRSHQSFILCLEKIEEITNDYYMSSYNVKMKNSHHRIPVSRNKYRDLKNSLSKLVILL